MYTYVAENKYNCYVLFVKVRQVVSTSFADSSSGQRVNNQIDINRKLTK